MTRSFSVGRSSLEIFSIKNNKKEKDIPFSFSDVIYIHISDVPLVIPVPHHPIPV